MRIGETSKNDINSTTVAIHVYDVITLALGSVFSELNLITASVTFGIENSEYTINPPCSRCYLDNNLIWRFRTQTNVCGYVFITICVTIPLSYVSFTSFSQIESHTKLLKPPYTFRCKQVKQPERVDG